VTTCHQERPAIETGRWALFYSIRGSVLRAVLFYSRQGDSLSIALI